MLFVEERLTDKAMLRVLQQEGYGISERTLRRLRFKLGLHARASSEQEQSQNQQDQDHLAISLPQAVVQAQPV